MRAAVLMLALTPLLFAGEARAQVWVGQSSPGSTPKLAASPYHPTPADPSALELVNQMGVRKHFETDRTNGVAQAMQELLRTYPGLTPAFADEWTRRVAAQMKPDDYAAIAARSYAAHFTDEELAQLTRSQMDLKAGHPSPIPQALKDKLRATLPTITGEISGGFTQVGATVGAQVAEQVAHEHPTWIKAPPTAPATASR